MPNVIKAFRYRIYPTQRQQRVLEDQLLLCAELYNAAIQERKEAWARAHKSISYFDQTLQLAEIKKVRSDVAAVSAIVL